MPGVSVYKKEDIPDHYHYKDNEHIHDIILSPNLGKIDEREERTNLMGAF